MIGVGVLGYGYWGPNLVRNFSEAEDARVVAVADLREDRLEAAARRYPGLKTTRDPLQVIHDPGVDAVVVATPVSRHFDLARSALEAGKHVLVEKPLAPKVEECRRLIEAAEKRRLVLMVDHTFVYTGAVRKIQALLEGGELGHVYYYDSVRVNLGLFQHDVNVLWDLAVHDLAIMDYVLKARPTAVAATGIANVAGQHANIAYLTCLFDANTIAHFHVNWLAPVKIRRTLVGGDRRMVVYDDLEPDEKLKIYDKGVTFDASSAGVYQMLVNYRAADMWAPQLDRTEALKTEATHFLECVTSGGTPLTDGRAGLRVVRVLEAAEASLAAGGAPVRLPVE